MNTPMNAAQIATLNRTLATARAARPDDSLHLLVHDVACSWGLEVVREDYNPTVDHCPIGILYRNSSGNHVYGHSSGEFDDHVD